MWISKKKFKKLEHMVDLLAKCASKHDKDIRKVADDTRENGFAINSLKMFKTTHEDVEKIVKKAFNNAINPKD